MTRLKNADFAASAMVIRVESRHIFNNGSSRFSKELALDETKQVRRDSNPADFVSSSSRRAVSSWVLRD